MAPPALTRPLAWLHLIGATLSVAWLAFVPHSPGAGEWAIALATGGAYAIGLVFLFGGGRLTLHAAQWLMLGTTAVISVAAAASDERGSVYALFYLWATLYAFSFFTRRAALVQILGVAVAYALAITFQRAHGEWHQDLSRWGLTLGTLLAAGWLVRTLREELREREQHLRFGIEHSRIGVAAIGFDGRVQEANEAWARLVGLPPDAVVGIDIERFRHPADPPIRARFVQEIAGAADAYRYERRFVRADGEVRWVAVAVSIVRDERDRPLHRFVQLDDITARRRRLDRQQALTQLARVALGGVPGDELAERAVAIVAEGLDAPRAAIALASEPGRAPVVVAARGWTPGAAQAATDARRRAADPAVIDGGGLALVPFGTSDDALGALCVDAAPRELDADDALFLETAGGILGVAEGRLDAERRMRHQALHDPLTGLPNRTLLLDRLESAIARATRNQGAVGAVFVDLDHFKVINDSLGHDAGDELLGQVAPRLAGVLRDSDTLARLGGDEFVVITEGGPDAAHVVRLAERLRGALEQPFSVRGDDLTITASLGVALARPGDGAAAVLRDADVAMYRAKELGRGRCELFDATLRERVLGRLGTEKALRGALAAGDFALAFQPVVELDGERPIAAEALLRWSDPDRGPVSPAEFVPVAEETGLIVPIGAWVIAEACRHAARWEGIAGRPVGVTVNLSPRQLAQPELVGQVRRALTASALAPDRLTLEITETILLGDAERPLQALRELRGLGVHLALDDFGTGYSSLAYLTRLPLDRLKLDRAFVARLAPGSQEAAVSGAIAQMAAALGLAVVAEGVETPAQAAMLRELGIGLGQGYLFSPPETPAALEARLAAYASMSGCSNARPGSQPSPRG